MRQNEKLQLDVLDAIKGGPLLHAAEIGVIAQDSWITIEGEVKWHTQKEVVQK